MTNIQCIQKEKDNSTENLAKTQEQKPKTLIIREAHPLLVIRKMKINIRKYHVTHNRLSKKIFLMNSFIIPCTGTSIDLIFIAELYSIT